MTHKQLTYSGPQKHVSKKFVKGGEMINAFGNSDVTGNVIVHGSSNARVIGRQKTVNHFVFNGPITINLGGQMPGFDFLSLSRGLGRNPQQFFLFLQQINQMLRGYGFGIQPLDVTANQILDMHQSADQGVLDAARLVGMDKDLAGNFERTRALRPYVVGQMGRLNFVNGGLSPELLSQEGGDFAIQSASVANNLYHQLRGNGHYAPDMRKLLQGKSRLLPPPQELDAVAREITVQNARPIAEGVRSGEGVLVNIHPENRNSPIEVQPIVEPRRLLENERRE